FAGRGRVGLSGGSVGIQAAGAVVSGLRKIGAFRGSGRFSDHLFVGGHSGGSDCEAGALDYPGSGIALGGPGAGSGVWFFARHADCDRRAGGDYGVCARFAGTRGITTGPVFSGGRKRIQLAGAIRDPAEVSRWNEKAAWKGRTGNQEIDV